MSSPLEQSTPAPPADSDSPSGSPRPSRGRFSPTAAATAASGITSANSAVRAAPPPPDITSVRRSSASQFYVHPSRTPVLSSVLAELQRREQDGMALDDAANGGAAAAERPWANGSSTPTFSRAFDLFTTAEPAEASFATRQQDRFFVPSYLEGSIYVQKLQEAHRAKLQAQRESKRSAGNGVASNPPAFASPVLPPGSHRGLSHSVIERPPPFEAIDDLAPLPTRWNKDDMWGGIEIQPDGLSVKYTGPKNPHERDHEACAVRADHFMPPECGIYYYEVQIMSGKRDDTTIAVGFSTKTTTLSRPVGWEPESWGYHGDDGRCFTAQNTGRSYGPDFNTGDVIGCGVNFRDNTAFFTKNGVWRGVAFHDVLSRNLYPTISLKKLGEHIRVNFGQTPFVYNIDDMMREQRDKIQHSIGAADTSKLEPGVKEAELIQTLVLQFLQHDGYVETARAFAEDIQVQKQALSLDPETKVAGINIKDDEDANNRQRIRGAILEGDIDRALKYTTAYYPHVLPDNEQVYFRLRCRRFIEMVRKAALLNMASDSRTSNGHAPDSSSQEMDLDLNGSEGRAWGESMEMDGADSQADLMDLERTMLEYGQTLQAEYANDPRREISKALDDIFPLVAYRNPLKEPTVSHLLDRKGRVAVAEELNSAILLSLGKSSRASLETLYAQTAVLLEDLRQDGGDGAFVSLQDVVDDIPKSTQI